MVFGKWRALHLAYTVLRSANRHPHPLQHRLHSWVWWALCNQNLIKI